MTRERGTPRPPTAARRGVALMMVLSVIAVASVLSWAMLSSSAVRSQVDANSLDALDAQYLAESGVSYAIYYLRYPTKSPVGLTQGPYDKYYAGQAGLTLWPDARSPVDVAVANTGQYQFRVRSTASIRNCRRTVEADVMQVMGGFKVTVAAGFNGDFTLTSNMRFDGPFVLKGTLNGPSGSIVNSPTPVGTGNDVIPVASDVALLNETNTAATSAGISGAASTDRTYTYNGGTYCAEKAPTTVSAALATTRSSLNPMNVWYSDSNVTMTGVSFTGTLVLRGSATLTVQGANTVTAGTGMPAIIAKRVDLKNTSLLPAKLTVNGILWAGDKISTSGTNRSDGLFKVSGALLMDAVPRIENITSPVQVTYTGSAGTVKNLTTTKFVQGVNVIRWALVD